MEDFSFNTLTALIAANKAITGGIISTLLAALLIMYYWEKVAYFVMRVWHGVPLIGSVARLSRASITADHKGWLMSEASLCNSYYDYYQEVGDKTSDFYNKCESYLGVLREGNRRERPHWVLLLILVLICVEAVGFAYVLVPFINNNASSNLQTVLAWGAAFLLSILSAGAAEAAGKAVRNNALVKKVRHWWQMDKERDGDLYERDEITIQNTHSDADEKTYHRVLARIETNESVTPKYIAIGFFAAVIIFMATAAFFIRSYQLTIMETEAISNPSAFMEPSKESASPFDLPADSAAVKEQAEEQTVSEKMDATRKASLITYVVLSVIYLAIQMLSLWIASIYGFVGKQSKKAWEYTHKFNNAHELERWMENQRTRIAAHADHKLRKLQMNLSKRITTDSKVLDALSTTHGRDFNAYVVRKQDEAHTHRSKPAVDAPATVQQQAAPVAQPVAAAPAPAPEPVAAPVQAAPAPAVVAEAPAPSAAPAAPAADVSELKTRDLTAYSDDQLATICRHKGYDLEAALALRAEQQLLKDFDKVGA